MKPGIGGEPAGQTLKESEENLRTILNSIGDAVLSTDRSGRFSGMNPAAEALTGWREDDARGEPLERVFHVVDEKTKKRIENPVTTTLREGGVINLADNTLLVSREGREIPIAVTGTPIRDNQGNVKGVVLVFRDQTEDRLTRHMTEALRQSDERLRIAGKAAYDLIYEWDVPTNAMKWFGEVDRLLGYEEGEVSKDLNSWLAVIHPEDMGKLEDAVEHHRSSPEPIEYEYRIRHRDGTYRTWRDHGLPIVDDDGSPVRWVGVCTDITDSRRAEVALRKSEERFKLAADASRDGLWDWNVDTDEVYYSPAYAAMLGYTMEEVLANVRFWKELIHPEDREAALASNRDCIENRRAEFETEFRMRAKSGEWRWILSRGKAVDRDGNGRALRMVGTHTDITERKRVEEDLRASKERFRNLAEMLPEAIFETDPDLHVTFANRRAFELFGYTGDDIAGGMSGLRFITPEDRDRARENVDLRSKGQDPGTVEYRGLRKDGSTFPMLFHASAIMMNGRLFGFRGVVVDMTDLKSMEEERARLEEQYRETQKVEAIGRLAGGVSHDLNNLLTPILCYGEMLLEDLDPDDVRRESVEEIMSAGDRAKELITQLLAFSRKQTLEYWPVDMNKAIVEFEKLLRRAIREDVEIEIKLSPAIRTIMADIGQIEQVIMNLAVNAQDAMPDGGKLSIETAVVGFNEEGTKDFADLQPGGYVELAVSDTGKGMDDETRGLVFEPFFSTKGALGTGLGLATVYGIIRQHGGAVQVDSEPGRGTTFRVYLPISKEPRIRAKSEEREVGRLEGTETILVAEDDDQVLQLALSILKRKGYTLLDARNGVEALAVLKAYDGDVDLLLTDVIMPGMNGKELYSKVVEFSPNLDVLYMSGYNDDVIAHHGVLDEGIALIQKPFTARALARKVREVLEKF